MVKNITTPIDEHGDMLIQGDEVYFELMPEWPQPDEAAVNAEFDTYWENGAKWPEEDKKPSTDERITALEADSLTALEGIAELYEMILQYRFSLAAAGQGRELRGAFVQPWAG